MTKHVRFLAVGAVLCALAAAAIAATVTADPASAARPKHTVAAPITAQQSGGVLDGTFNITSFSVNSASQLVANGTFTGTALVNGATQTVSTPAAAVVNAQATCQVLDLTLGPLHLDLLGLVVDLNQVHLNITAQQGPGNLLGNLLCAITNLLNGSGSPNALQQIVNLLNQILGAL